MTREIVELILETDKLTQSQKTDILKEMLSNRSWYPNITLPKTPFPYDTHIIPCKEEDLYVKSYGIPNRKSTNPFQVDFIHAQEMYNKALRGDKE